MSEKTTPMMAQYRSIRNELPADTILFFRLGDFYEMFFDDAKVASQVLDIALTKRNKVPMCGIPYHAAETYLAKIIRAGVKVAICDQVEDPAQAKGIVRREVTRVVTPGTILEENVLDSNRNNFLAGICRSKDAFGVALLDISTGTFWVEEEKDLSAVRDNMMRYAPSECVIPEEEKDSPHFASLLNGNSPTVLTAHDDWTFEYDSAADILTRHFKVHSLRGFGCEHCTAGICAAGAVLHYVQQELRRKVDHIRQIRAKNPRDYLLLDEATVRNLDLIPVRGLGVESSANLLKVLDSTKTAMGGRLLRDWSLRPLSDLNRITARHDAVDAFTSQRSALTDLRESFSEIKDLERLVSRLSAGSSNARDLRALAQSLSALPALKKILEKLTPSLLVELNSQIQPLPELAGLIDRAIVNEPPATMKDGGVIREGYSPELDELRDAASAGKKWLAEFQVREQKRTGIKTLKVRHNRVFGYYIEVTKSNLDGVPEDYIRKQTLVNAERFITPELKEYENRIMGAQERSLGLEAEILGEVRDEVVKQTDQIQATADAVAQVDVLTSFAERALALRYARPAMNGSQTVIIKDGRHPIIEEMLDAEPFVPNDALLDELENQLIIITGPNMAGKSTYIRQVALIVIMAQMGSFVPADSAEIGVVDRVFTRVGASDDLARGRSTFMVEMQETANILNNATGRSLIVLDEIGRGTSTFDGISIAWAVAEYLHNQKEVKAKTLFATHYHELTDLALTLPGVKNYNVLVREKNDRIAFLRKIVPGSADKSYGIQVAQLAGLPAEVIARAKEILGNLEEGEFEEQGQPKIAKHRPKKSKSDPDQMSLFADGQHGSSSDGC
ncbi:MAG: DNA mismatch repair protein MutS [Verrucomicrobia bacterium]|nr:DNA mismatch repair protein MutS [Verrucomicrobiota bacterium]